MVRRETYFSAREHGTRVSGLRAGIVVQRHRRHECAGGVGEELVPARGRVRAVGGGRVAWVVGGRDEGGPGGESR